PQPIRGSASEPVELKQPRKPLPAVEKKPTSEKAPAAKAETESRDDKAEPSETGAPGSAEVVSLDAFRKKN
ncbi:MAG TPA: Stringent starvation protein B, partial [Microvirga sp.]|nr:Stringent starvation protein B [Microvirga sp.]